LKHYLKLCVEKAWTLAQRLDSAAPAHKALSAKQFVAQKSVTESKHNGGEEIEIQPLPWMNSLSSSATLVTILTDCTIYKFILHWIADITS
jgi:hypothetical protein